MLAKPFSQYQVDAALTCALPWNEIVYPVQTGNLPVWPLNASFYARPTCGYLRQFKHVGLHDPKSETRRRRLFYFLGFSLELSGSGFNLHRFHIYVFPNEFRSFVTIQLCQWAPWENYWIFSFWFWVSGTMMGLSPAEPVWNENWKLLEEKADNS